MAQIYIAFVDTPGFFAGIIRRTIRQKYIHVAVGLDPYLEEAYSIGRRHPSIPLIAGFEKEDKRKILRAFPGADYMVCSMECTAEQKKYIENELRKAMKRRFRYHYAVLGLPFILMNRPFYQKDHYTCSSYIARLLEEAGVCRWGKHFSLVTPKDFYEYRDKQKIFEGSLRELADAVRKEPELKRLPVFHLARPAFAGTAYIKPAYQNMRNRGGQNMSARKRALQIGLFLVIMLMTFYALFSGRNLSEIAHAVAEMSPLYLIPAVGLAVFFVCAEGYMIWYLLRSMKAHKSGGKGTSLFRCIQYSFIGFFYSGITPSASGGQPVQLYYMNKDGNRGSDSTVVLMTVAVAYKFVLVVMGFGILLLWFHPLTGEMGKYFPLYLLGLSLNVILVIIILGVMLFPKVILKAAMLFEGLLIRMKIWKPSDKREGKIREFIDSYGNAVTWLKAHKGKLAFIIFVTFLQRCSVFVLTYMVYLGFGLEGTSAMKVILLQASVYIAVDMLPLPGAQGITELMYQAVFAHVFTGMYLIPSMLVSRGINFYFLLVVSLVTVIAVRIGDKRSRARA